MKILESTNRFSILSDRFIGVHTTKEKDDEVKDYYQIFDTKTLTLFPQTFKGIKCFNGDYGIIRDFNNSCHYVMVDEFYDLKVFDQEFKNCSEIKNGIAVVEMADKTSHFVKIEKDKIERLSPDFKQCYLPKENLACVQFEDEKWAYARASKNGFKLLNNRFMQISDFAEGYGRVQDFDGNFHYAFCVNDEIKVLPHSYKYCYPIKEGIARIQNDDLTICYAKLHGEDVNILSKDYKYAFEFNNGVGRVIHDDDTVSFLQKTDNENQLKILGTKEYNENLNCSQPKFSFPNAEDFSENVCTVVNKDKESVSFGIKDGKSFKMLSGKYQNAGKVIDNVARVEYMEGGEGYIVFDDKGFKSASEKYAKVQDFSCGIGMVKNPYGTETYVKVVDGYIRNFASNYINCFKYNQGFGMVKNSETKYAILDTNGLPLLQKENLREAVENNKKYAKFYSKKLKEIEDIQKKKQAFIEEQLIR